ncbi:MAG: hypothetical protein E7464_06005 [Ruminococcaceae bacterium]|nr:hypothetical protein [Oscillospiraceae bacterium]
MKRLTAILLTLALLLGVLPPMEARADAVRTISTAEEFLAIMDDPGGSYRLENDIHLGTIVPIGHDAEYWRSDFTGSLDGNGHTVSYSMEYVPGCNKYSLFAQASGAEFVNLRIDADISVDAPEDGQYYVGALVAYTHSACSFAELSFTGRLHFCSGSSGNLYIGGVAGFDCGGHTLYQVDSDLDINASTNINMQVRYGGLLFASSAIHCNLHGNAFLEGNVENVRLLYQPMLSNATQNVTVYGGDSITFRSVLGGTGTNISGNYEFYTFEGVMQRQMNLCVLEDCTSSSYNGRIDIYPSEEDLSNLYLGQNGSDLDITANLSYKGELNGNVYGLQNCVDSDLNAQLDIANYSTVNLSVYLLEGSDRCTAKGNTKVFSRGKTALYGASYGTHCRVTGDLRLEVAENRTANLYGLNAIETGGFDGNLSIRGGSSGSLVGAQDGGYNIVNANVISDNDQVRIWGLNSHHSVFRGRVSVTGGIVHGAVGDNNMFIGTVEGDSCYGVDGEKSYFSGNIYSTKWVRVCTEGSAAKGSVTVDAEGGAYYDCEGLFSGDASITTQHGEIVMGLLEGQDCSWAHMESGQSGTANSLRAMTEEHSKEDDLSYGSCHWHNAPDTKNCYIFWHKEFMYHLVSGYGCYQCVASAYFEEPTYTKMEEIDWSEGIDPYDEVYEPNLGAHNYQIAVEHGDGNPVYSYKLTIAGEDFYPDYDGTIHFEDSPIALSPLTVSLLVGDEYQQVLHRTAFYAIPDRLNTIRLEPSLEGLEFTLLEDGAEPFQNEGESDAMTIDILGYKVDLLKETAQIDLHDVPWPVRVKTEPAGNGRIYVSLGTFKDAKDLADPKELCKGGMAKLDYLYKKGALSFDKNGNMKLMGSKCETSILGYLEMGKDPETNGWVIYTGGIIAGLDMNVRKSIHIPQLLYAVYVTGAMGLDAKFNANAEISAQNAISYAVFTLMAELNTQIYAEFAVGTGSRAVDLYVEGGFRGHLDTKLQLPLETLSNSLSMRAALDGFLEWRVFFLGGRETYPLWEKQLWPRKDSKGADLTASGELSVLPRDYLKATKAGEGSSYPYSEVQLLPLEDGRYLLIYTDDDASRGDADRSALRACIGQDMDGQLHWGEAVTIEDDGTGDYGFSACAIGNGGSAAVIWQDMDMEFGSGEGADVHELATHVDLTRAILDCRGDVPEVRELSVVPTEAGTYESLPMVWHYSDENGDYTRFAWLTCNENTPLPSENARFTIWMAEGMGEGYIVAEDQETVKGMALLSSELLWSAPDGLWRRDNEGNIARMWEGNVENLLCAGDHYCFIVDGELHRGEGAFENEYYAGNSSLFGGILQLCADGNLYYAMPGQENSTLYRIDGEIARPVGEYEGYLSAWDAAHGHVVTVLREGFEAGDAAAMNFGREEDIQRLCAGEVLCDEPFAAPGSWVNLCADVRNDGTYPVEQLPITVTAQDGTVLMEEIWDVWIESGETQVFEFGFPLPEDFSPQDVAITLGEAAFTYHLGGSNLRLEANWRSSDPGGISVDVMNTGSGTASGTVILQDGEGKELARQDVTVEQQGGEYVWLPFEEYYFEPADLTVLLEEEGGNPADNEVMVAVRPIKALGVAVSHNMTLRPGEEAWLDVRAIPDGSVMPALSFRSENEDIAVVDEGGLVRAVSPGKVSIIVTDEAGQEQTVLVTVTGDEYIPENPFRDVEEGSFYYDAVLWAADAGITTGTGEGVFSPLRNCTRAQVVTFLWRAAGSPEPENMALPFRDVDADGYYAKAVAWAVENGITTGTGNGSTFSPDMDCTRAQVVTFLWRASGSPWPEGRPDFTDVPENSYYTQSVAWAVEREITLGTGGGKFSPDAVCTRAQIVTFLYRAFA